MCEKPSVSIIYPIYTPSDKWGGQNNRNTSLYDAVQFSTNSSTWSNTERSLTCNKCLRLQSTSEAVNYKYFHFKLIYFEIIYTYIYIIDYSSEFTDGLHQFQWALRCPADVSMLTFNSEGSFSAELQVRWENYVHFFIKAWYLVHLYSLGLWTFSEMKPSQKCLVVAILLSGITKLYILHHISWTKRDNTE